MSYMSTSARANAGLAPTTEAPHHTGVVSTGVVDLTNQPDDDDDPGTVPIPKVGEDDTITDKNNDITDAVETAQVDAQVQPTEYGHRRSI